MGWANLDSNLQAAFIGATVAVAVQTVTTFLTWVNKKKATATSWEMIRIEIKTCHEQANGYLNDSVKKNIYLPLYRWPDDAYRTLFKTIIDNGEIDPQEIQPIRNFYNMVDQVNLGFDYTTHAYNRYVDRPATKVPRRWASVDTSPRFTKEQNAGRLFVAEVKRLILKTQHLQGNTKDQYEAYNAAVRVAQRHHDRFQKLCWRILFALP